MDSFARLKILPILMFVLSACGGGGGGGGVSGGSAGTAANNLPSVLEFKAPDSFANGRTWSTKPDRVSLEPGLNRIRLSTYEKTIGDHGSFAADWVDGTLVVFDGRQVFTYTIN